jgi:hypothetical protein
MIAEVLGKHAIRATNEVEGRAKPPFRQTFELWALKSARSATPNENFERAR